MSRSRTLQVASFCKEIASCSKWRDLGEHCIEDGKHVVYKGTISVSPTRNSIGRTILFGKPRFTFGDASYHWTSKMGGFAGIWVDQNWNVRGFMGHLTKIPSSESAEFDVLKRLAKKMLDCSNDVEIEEESPLTFTSDSTRVVDCYNNSGNPKTLHPKAGELWRNGMQYQEELRQKNIKTRVKHFNSGATDLLARLMSKEARMLKRKEEVGGYLMNKEEEKFLIKSVPGINGEEFSLICSKSEETEIKLSGYQENGMMVYELDSETLFKLVGPELINDLKDIRDIVEKEDNEIEDSPKGGSSSSPSKSSKQGRSGKGEPSNKSPKKGGRKGKGKSKNW